jgi:hypothetical protein
LTFIGLIINLAYITSSGSFKEETNIMRELSQIISHVAPTKDTIPAQSEGHKTLVSFPNSNDHLDEEFASGIDYTAIDALQDEVLATTIQLASNALPDNKTYGQSKLDPVAETSPSMEAIHQAINQGEDPGELLAATASGSGPVTEGGHGFVQVAALGQHTTPTSGISTSTSTNYFDLSIRSVPNTSQQPLDFSTTIDITVTQENSASNSVTFTSFTLTDDQDTTPLELNLTPEITDIEILAIEGPETNPGGFVYTHTTQTTPTSGFDTEGPALAFEPSPEPLIVIIPDEVL